MKVGKVPLLAIRVNDKDYILSRYLDFFEEVADIPFLYCKETLKLHKDYLKNLPELGFKVYVNDKWWLLSTLDTFISEVNK